MGDLFVAMFRAIGSRGAAMTQGRIFSSEELAGSFDAAQAAAETCGSDAKPQGRLTPPQGATLQKSPAADAGGAFQ